LLDGNDALNFSTTQITTTDKPQTSRKTSTGNMPTATVSSNDSDPQLSTSPSTTLSKIFFPSDLNLTQTIEDKSVIFISNISIGEINVEITSDNLADKIVEFLTAIISSSWGLNNHSIFVNDVTFHTPDPVAQNSEKSTIEFISFLPTTPEENNKTSLLIDSVTKSSLVSTNHSSPESSMVNVSQFQTTTLVNPVKVTEKNFSSNFSNSASLNENKFNATLPESFKATTFSSESASVNATSQIILMNTTTPSHTQYSSTIDTKVPLYQDNVRSTIETVLISTITTEIPNDIQKPIRIDSHGQSANNLSNINSNVTTYISSTANSDQNTNFATLYSVTSTMIALDSNVGKQSSEDVTISSTIETNQAKEPNLETVNSCKMMDLSDSFENELKGTSGKKLTLEPTVPFIYDIFENESTTSVPDFFSNDGKTEIFLNIPTTNSTSTIQSLTFTVPAVFDIDDDEMNLINGIESQENSNNMTFSSNELSQTDINTVQFMSSTEKNASVKGLTEKPFSSAITFSEEKTTVTTQLDFEDTKAQQMSSTELSESDSDLFNLAGITIPTMSTTLNDMEKNKEHYYPVKFTMPATTERNLDGKSGMQQLSNTTTVKNINENANFFVQKFNNTVYPSLDSSADTLTTLSPKPTTTSESTTTQFQLDNFHSTIINFNFSSSSVNYEYQNDFLENATTESQMEKTTLLLSNASKNESEFKITKAMVFSNSTKAESSTYEVTSNFSNENDFTTKTSLSILVNNTLTFASSENTTVTAPDQTISLVERSNTTLTATIPEITFQSTTVTLHFPEETTENETTIFEEATENAFENVTVLLHNSSTTFTTATNEGPTHVDTTTSQIAENIETFKGEVSYIPKVSTTENTEAANKTLASVVNDTLKTETSENTVEITTTELLVNNFTSTTTTTTLSPFEEATESLLDSDHAAKENITVLPQIENSTLKTENFENPVKITATVSLVNNFMSTTTTVSPFEEVTESLLVSDHAAKENITVLLQIENDTLRTETTATSDFLIFVETMDSLLVSDQENDTTLQQIEKGTLGTDTSENAVEITTAVLLANIGTSSSTTSKISSSEETTESTLDSIQVAKDIVTINPGVEDDTLKTESFKNIGKNKTALQQANNVKSTIHASEFTSFAETTASSAAAIETSTTLPRLRNDSLLMETTHIATENTTTILLANNGKTSSASKISLFEETTSTLLVEETNTTVPRVNNNALIFETTLVEVENTTDVTLITTSNILELDETSVPSLVEAAIDSSTNLPRVKNDTLVETSYYAIENTTDIISVYNVNLTTIFPFEETTSSFLVLNEATIENAATLTSVKNNMIPPLTTQNPLLLVSKGAVIDYSTTLTGFEIDNLTISITQNAIQNTTVVSQVTSVTFFPTKSENDQATGLTEKYNGTLTGNETLKQSTNTTPSVNVTESTLENQATTIQGFNDTFTRETTENLLDVIQSFVNFTQPTTTRTNESSTESSIDEDSSNAFSQILFRLLNQTLGRQMLENEIKASTPSLEIVLATMDVDETATLPNYLTTTNLVLESESDDNGDSSVPFSKLLFNLLNTTLSSQTNNITNETTQLIPDGQSTRSFVALPLRKSDESDSSLLQTNETIILQRQGDDEDGKSKSFSQLLFDSLNRSLALDGGTSLELTTNPKSETLKSFSSIFDEFMASMSLKAILDRSEPFLY
jgi:hypothetical protein